MKVAASNPPAPRPTPAVVWRAYQGVSTNRIDETGLIERHLPLVRDVVERIKISLPSHIDAGDLYSVGIGGLIAAVRHYGPEQGRTFAAYATVRIHDAILDELRRMEWCPRSARARSRKLKNAINDVEQKLGRPATNAEVCAELGLGKEEYAKWVEETWPVAFIAIEQDASNDEGGCALPDKRVPDDTNDPGDKLEKAGLSQLLAQRIAELPDMQKRILAMYYFENMRLAEIAVAFDLAESQVRQIHAQAVLTLRARIQRARNR